MHEIKITQNVSSIYKPYIQIFAYMYNSGSFRQFEKIQTISLYRQYNNVVKKFEGTLEVDLQSKTKLWWFINGDFYNVGSQEISISGSGAIGKVLEASFSIGGSSDYFKYWNNSGEYHLY
jgi:hypothetical protein